MRIYAISRLTSFVSRGHLNRQTNDRRHRMTARARLEANEMPRKYLISSHCQLLAATLSAN